MTARIARNSIFALAALALSGSLALSQAPAQPAPAAPANPPAAAPIERQSPSGRYPGGYGPGPRQGGGQGGIRRGNFQARGNFGGGPGGFHGAAGFRGGQARGFSGGAHGAFGGRQGGPGGEGFHIGPPGMWWKNPAIVQRLTLTPDQTKKMDTIFQDARIQLIDLRASVEKQNALLEPLLAANPPDTAKALAQIDKVAQARADLEKANAKMLLGIRGVLTPDQWTKLTTHGRGTPDAQGAPTPPAGGPGGGRTRGMRAPAPPSGSNLIDPIDQP